MAKKEQRRSHLEGMADLLSGLMQGQSQALSHQFLCWRLSRQWSEVVGPFYDKKTQVVEYNRGVLWIYVSSSPLLHELSFFSGEFRRKVNEYVGRNWVKQIKFTLEKRGMAKLK